MLKNIFKIIVVFVFGMAGGIFADQILWPYFIERPLFYKYRLEQAPINVTEIKEITITENIALKEAVEKVKNVVVGIQAETKGKVLGGSGFVVTSDGLMITLAELVPSGSDFQFFVDGEQPSFQIIKRDPKNNLALIKLEKSNLQTCGFGSLDKVKLGERVFLVGVIFEEDIPQKMVDEGIVKYFDSNSIHTNISEKSTIAGSPLFDIEGNLLGVNTIDRQGETAVIPISKIREFIGF